MVARWAHDPEVVSSNLASNIFIKIKFGDYNSVG